MSRLLLLVRHGITDWNRQGRFQGHADPPLDAQGRRQAALLAARLARDPLRPTRIVSSSLARARQTAEILARGLTGGRLSTDPRLMEIGQGDWEGRTHAELERDDAERYAAWRSRADGHQPPGAEPLQAVRERALACLAELEPGLDGGPICLVSHGGTLRLLARELLGLQLRQAWGLDLDNASLSVLERLQEGWGLRTWNDMAHLLRRQPLHIDEREGEPLAL